jgi:hypothetical protein
MRAAEPRRLLGFSSFDRGELRRAVPVRIAVTLGAIETVDATTDVCGVTSNVSSVVSIGRL